MLYRFPLLNAGSYFASHLSSHSIPSPRRDVNVSKMNVFFGTHPNQTVFRFVTRRYTPLHWASQKGHTHTVQALLAAGASVHVVSVPRGKIGLEKGKKQTQRNYKYFELPRCLNLSMLQCTESSDYTRWPFLKHVGDFSSKAKRFGCGCGWAAPRGAWLLEQQKL